MALRCLQAYLCLVYDHHSPNTSLDQLLDWVDAGAYTLTQAQVSSEDVTACNMPLGVIEGIIREGAMHVCHGIVSESMHTWILECHDVCMQNACLACLHSTCHTCVMPASNAHRIYSPTALHVCYLK